MIYVFRRKYLKLTLMLKVFFLPDLALLQILHMTHPPRATKPSKTRLETAKRMPNTRE